MEQVFCRLKQEGWALDEQAAAAFLQDAFPGSAAPSASAVAEALLNVDLRQLGAGGLPDDVNRAPALKLAGPIVLQVRYESLLECRCLKSGTSVSDAAPRSDAQLTARRQADGHASIEARDIAQPSRTASESSERRGRLLRLALTDGKARCVGLELHPLPLSAEQLLPGTKLALSGVTVRLGVLLLEPRNVRLLGGRVDALAEAWETQQRYGGTAIERPEAADAERPPPFRHFDPKLAKHGSRRGAIARAAAAVAPAPPSGGVPARQPGAAAALAGQPAAAAASAEGSKAPLQGRQQQAQQQRQGGQQQREGRVRRGAQPYQPPAARQPQQPPQPDAQHEQQQQQQQPAAQQRDATEPQQQHTEHQGQGRQPAAHGNIAGPPQQAPPPAEAPGAGRPGGAAPAAAHKLLERLQVEEGRYGRGQPRRRRRSRYDDDEDDGSMTLEEWEARQKGGGGSAGGSGGAGLAALQRQQHGQQGQPLSDEELARQLQRQLDLEAAAEWGTPLNGAPADDLAASLQAMFAYGGGGEEGRDGGGRGGRGGRGGGRGRGRGRGRR